MDKLKHFGVTISVKGEDKMKIQLRIIWQQYPGALNTVMKSTNPPSKPKERVYIHMIRPLVTNRCETWKFTREKKLETWKWKDPRKIYGRGELGEENQWGIG